MMMLNIAEFNYKFKKFTRKNAVITMLFLVNLVQRIWLVFSFIALMGNTTLIVIYVTI